MHEELLERIELLRQSEQIDEELYAQLPAIVSRTEQFLNLTLNEENAGSYVSHIAKAAMRIKQGEPVQDGAKGLLEQARGAVERFRFALSLLEPYRGDIPESSLEIEAAYIVAYLEALEEETA